MFINIILKNVRSYVYQDVLKIFALCKNKFYMHKRIRINRIKRIKLSLINNIIAGAAHFFYIIAFFMYVLQHYNRFMYFKEVESRVI